MGEVRTGKPKDEQSVRDRALDPEGSFLVQAPAGSGKTTLLVMRFLTLLARVDEPEEVLALTFTRKAQAEMTHRIWQALSATDRSSPLAGPVELVRQRSQALGWNLERMPQRLRIMTIDGFALGLIQKMPWSAGRGQIPRVTERAESLYLEAARRVIEELPAEPDYREAIGTWLVEVGGDPEVLAGSLARMLAVREQWQGLLYTAGRERRLGEGSERAGLHLFRDTYLRCHHDLTPGRFQRWLDLAQAVRTWRQRLDSQVGAPPEKGEGKEADCADPWTVDRLWEVEALTNLFFTKEKTVRRPRGIHNLFKAKKDTPHELRDERESLSRAIVAELERLESDPGGIEILHKLDRLPRILTQDSVLLERVLVVLARALYQLQQLFRETATVDFSEITGMALEALGEEDPTDLALALDYRIQHLLVDEFQDTSIAHYTLLRQLMRGWQPRDGHTFFAVGDPLQSIYRFRQAEVGVFLNCQERGLPGFPLETLVLHDNYRSHPALVDWFNHQFSGLFPATDDPESGAVRYNPVQARQAGQQGEVRAHVHRVAGNAPDDRARWVVELIRRERNRNPVARIAVLVDTHDDAEPIARLLRTENLPFRALDLEPLDDFGVVQDLLMLSLALLHPGDRRAWLAVLRAPWIGLSLADLAALEEVPLIPSGAIAPWPHANLSADGRARLDRAWPVLTLAFERLSRTHRLREVIEAVWLELGGPALYGHDFDLALAERFLDMLDEHPAGEWRADPLRLPEAVAGLRAPHEVETEDPRLELLTIHRAKGLEWDVVILGGLNHVPPQRDSRLLAWLERIGPEGPEVIMATADAASLKPGRRGWYQYLKAIEQEKNQAERIRLAYVAATRARERLHLVALAGSGETPKPRKGSLAEVFGSAFSSAEPVEAPASGSNPEARTAAVRFRRREDFPGLEWPVERGASQADGSVEAPVPARPAYDWAENEARVLGLVLHEICAWISRLGWERSRRWHNPDSGARKRWERLLVEGGIAPQRVEPLERELGLILERIVRDPEARWILGPHPWAACELALQGGTGPERARIRVDRLFREPDGTFWIIDYKLGRHAGGDLEAFLRSEETRHRPQLERYARLFSQVESGPLRLGLYFFEPARFHPLMAFPG
jgi:ATP-dependent exoDNAse (exonuclease V) beta subunit